MPKFVFLWTDVFLYCLVVAVLLYGVRVARSPALRATWASVGRTPSAMSAAVFLVFFAAIGLADSIHYRPLLPEALRAQSTNGPRHASTVRSLLDDMLSSTRMPLAETTYSAPLAIRQFTKETELIDGKPVRDYPRLRHAGQNLKSEAGRAADIRARAIDGMGRGAAFALALALVLSVAGKRHQPERSLLWWWRGETGVPWRAMWITMALLAVLVGATLSLAMEYHVLGTDRTGNDVLWQALKSIRTALVIGTLTTVAMLPPALFFGISAGYFKGRIDDVIQYIYTTLTSIPGVLLIAACVLMMQVYIDNNPHLFPTSVARADLRLFLLCLILGLTGWAGLCRLLRAEVLKLRELDYVQAARAFGIGHWRIMRRHLLPNVMHIVLITLVLEFSGLVLYEAVLSYLGIGVDPSMNSFGSMINSARFEMSRDPMIWWSLLAAFVFMLALVLSANIFADAVQAAFDPRTRRYRPARIPSGGAA